MLFVDFRKWTVMNTASVCVVLFDQSGSPRPASQRELSGGIVRQLFRFLYLSTGYLVAEFMCTLMDVLV